MADLLIQYVTATSGSVSITDNQQDVQVIHEAGLTLNLTFVFPPNPKNNQRVSIASVNGIGVLNLNAVITILSPLSSLAGGATGSWLYYAPMSKWYRIRL